MNRKLSNILLAFFIIVSILDLLAVTGIWSQVRPITKPLLMPLLLAFFVARVGWQSTIAKMTTLALVFSWMGDTFLLLEENNPLFFIFGLASFLLAHVVYIIIFRKTTGIQPMKVTIRWIVSALIIFYASMLVYYLWPSLADMKIPVIAYATVISLMGISAIFRNVEGKYIILSGALIFIISDSLLAINKFSTPFAYAGLAVMTTYLIAQTAIVYGMIRFLKTSH